MTKIDSIVSQLIAEIKNTLDAELASSKAVAITPPLVERIDCQAKRKKTNRKWTDAELADVRARARRKETYADIGRAYDVSDSTIGSIVRTDQGPKVEKRKAMRRWTETEIIAVREQAAAGVPYSRLSREYGVSESTIGAIARRDSWRHIE